ncbi:hypothetical protein [Actinomycetospora termitidis]|uniref:Uncharacterized protein n=1 Tax=Actinomycetospora termitidis TaxID=3053470 RepID=A0ABT7MHY4_9PSEU|nr:hypothetical protein [Actinomycetospora sp. Odt1-22]MDL5158938.1 hypothetical protein [Actinomycetospora sp. Odt1-22]
MHEVRQRATVIGRRTRLSAHRRAASAPYGERAGLGVLLEQVSDDRRASRRALVKLACAWLLGSAFVVVGLLWPESSYRWAALFILPGIGLLLSGLVCSTSWLGDWFRAGSRNEVLLAGIGRMMRAATLPSRDVHQAGPRTVVLAGRGGTEILVYAEKNWIERPWSASILTVALQNHYQELEPMDRVEEHQTWVADVLDDFEWIATIRPGRDRTAVLSTPGDGRTWMLSPEAVWPSEGPVPTSDPGAALDDNRIDGGRYRPLTVDGRVLFWSDAGVVDCLGELYDFGLLGSLYYFLPLDSVHRNANEVFSLPGHLSVEAIGFVLWRNFWVRYLLRPPVALLHDDEQDRPRVPRFDPS